MRTSMVIVLAAHTLPLLSTVLAAPVEQRDSAVLIDGMTKIRTRTEEVATMMGGGGDGGGLKKRSQAGPPRSPNQPGEPPGGNGPDKDMWELDETELSRLSEWVSESLSFPVP